MANDLVIKNAWIVDGTGNPKVKGDIRVKGDKIAEIKREISEGSQTFNAERLIASPGFIDIHSHGDSEILKYRKAPNKVRQGITTILIGNCGDSLAPLTDKNLANIKDEHRRVDLDWDWKTFSEYLKKISEKEPSINIASLVGHNTVRSSVMGYEDRRPTQEEISEMKKLVGESMKAGAIGLSTGLGYVPGIYSETEELIELGKVVSRYNGIYTSHLRNQSEKLIEATEEAIEIGVRNNLPVQLSHYKATGESWKKINEAINLVEEKREEGVEVSYDIYPYRAASSSLKSVLPSWAREGSKEDILKRLKNSKTKDKMLQDLRKEQDDWNNIMISYSKENKDYEGERIDEIARNENAEPAQIFLNLLIEDELATRRVTFCMKEENIPKKLKHPLCSVGSDGRVHSPSMRGKPHPGYYGAFPKVLSKYVRRKKTLSLEEAIRKMTSLPAQKIGLRKRGVLKEGMKADMVVFDSKKIRDNSTYQNPIQYPEGIRLVMVNGEIVVRDGEHTGKPAGIVLKSDQTRTKEEIK